MDIDIAQPIYIHGTFGKESILIALESNNYLDLRVELNGAIASCI